MEKASCLQALKDEYERLGRPLARLRYTGKEAKEHVRRLMSSAATTTTGAGPGEVSGSEVPAAPAPAPDPHAGAAIVPYTEEDGAMEAPDNGTYSYQVVFIAGVWYLVQYLHDEQMGQVALPDIDSTGQGYWAMAVHEGVHFVHQGLDNIPVSDFFEESASVGTDGAAPESTVATLPGMMRLPDPDEPDSEEEMDGEAPSLIIRFEASSKERRPRANAPKPEASQTL